MSISSILNKSKFCFSITIDAWSGIKLLFWTIILVFYGRLFKKYLAANKNVYPLEIKTVHGGLKIRLRLQDISVFYEIFFYNIYHIDDMYIEEGDVIDAGAHIGLASLYLWMNYFPSSKFHCVEPSRENLELLKYNTRFLNRVIINKGISNYNGIATLDTTGYSHNYKLSSNDTGDVNVQVCTMANFIESYRIDSVALLKLDIEGEEEKIFKDLDNWFTKIKTILIEVHRNYKEGDLVNDTNSYTRCNLKAENINNITVQFFVNKNLLTLPAI